MVRRPTRQTAKTHLIYKIDESDDDDDFDESNAKSDDEESEATFNDTDDSDDELYSDVEPTPKKKPVKKRIPTVSCSITQTAPKIVALLQAIDEMKPDEKGVIFSQFTTFLDRIENALEASGHLFTRVDGSMNAMSRLEAMSDFSKEDVKNSTRFILCSLRAAGTGINLTQGNVVFMMDLWWNTSVQAQAMDRVHRLGQKRKVRVYTFVMKDSIEERMVTFQKAKAALGKGSMEKLSAREESRAKLTAMKDLFEIADEEEFYDSDDDFISASFDDEATEDSIEEGAFIGDHDDEIAEGPLDELTDDNCSAGISLDEFSDDSDDELLLSD